MLYVINYEKLLYELPQKLPRNPLDLQEHHMRTIVLQARDILFSPHTGAGGLDYKNSRYCLPMPEDFVPMHYDLNDPVWETRAGRFGMSLRDLTAMSGLRSLPHELTTGIDDKRKNHFEGLFPNHRFISPLFANLDFDVFAFRVKLLHMGIHEAMELSQK